MLSDFLSASRFLVVVVFSARDEFRRFPEEFRWKIFAGEDFQPIVVLAVLLLVIRRS